MPNGFLLVDKPAGLRSAACVALVKRLLAGNSPAKEKVGHAGTLDSTASGLLVVLLGAAARCSDYVMRLPKVYEAIVRLGAATDTCDASGEFVFRGDASKADERAFDRVLCSFLGTRMQVPPAISALKVNGRAAHRTARAGGDPGLAARPVTVTSAARSSPLADGRAKITVTCGKGTYVRAIARDIGERLGCGAHVETLRRLSIGPFRVSDACAPEAADAQRLLPCRSLGSVFQRVLLNADAERRLTNGLSVPLSEAGRYVPGTLSLESGLCVEGGTLFGFAGLDEKFLLRPQTNILDAAEPATFEISGDEKLKFQEMKI
ncbi:MAG: tRNA pseudouridine(55) synthase TruB [Synergistaceae bacterium]|jgi:tRNA pseudouridine(55) synthase|nr:tRNA pseudouridine(55) synthase TruB [Synergistaceae bacterium]